MSLFMFQYTAYVLKGNNGTNHSISQNLTSQKKQNKFCVKRGEIKDKGRGHSNIWETETWNPSPDR